MQEIILNWLLWLEPHAQLTWQVSTACLCLLMLLFTHLAEKNSINKNTWAWIALLSFAIIKIPLLSWQAASPNEDDWIASAITLREYPEFWWKYCFWSSQPFTVVPLSAFNLIGIEISYTSIKLFQFILQFTSVLIFLAAIQRIKSIRFTYYSTLIFWGILAFENHYNSIAYNPEDVGLFLSTILFYFSVKLIENPKFTFCILISFVLFLAVLTKEQFLPLTVAYLIGLGILSYKTLPRFTLMYILSSLFAFTGILVLAQMLSGGLEMLSYSIDGEVHNATGDEVADHSSILHSMHFRLTNALTVILATPELCAFYIPCVVLTIATFFVGGSLRQRWFLSSYSIISGATLAGAIITILIPTIRWSQYFNILHLPAAIFLICRLSETASPIAKQFPRIKEVGWLKGSLVCVFSLTALHTIARGNDALIGIKTSKRVSYTPDAVESYLVKHSIPGDRLIVWGYDTKYHNSADLALGSRFRHPTQILMNAPRSNRQMNLYKQDILACRPKFIVDIIHFKSHLIEGRDIRLNKFPSLYSIIIEDYNSIDFANGATIYVLKSKAKGDPS